MLRVTGKLRTHRDRLVQGNLRVKLAVVTAPSLPQFHLVELLPVDHEIVGHLAQFKGKGRIQLFGRFHNKATVTVSKEILIGLNIKA